MLSALPESFNGLGRHTVVVEDRSAVGLSTVCIQTDITSADVSSLVPSHGIGSAKTTERKYRKDFDNGEQHDRKEGIESSD